MNKAIAPQKSASIIGASSRRGALKTIILGVFGWLVARNGSATEEPKPTIHAIGFDPAFSGGDITVWHIKEGGEWVLVRQNLMSIWMRK